MTHHEKVEPTCTKEGTVEYYSCEDCKKNFADEKGTTEISELTIKATGHSVTHIPAKAPSAKKNGNIAYWYCTVCNQYFKDEALTSEITKADTVLPATNKSPKTGDNSNIILWLTFMDVALCGLLGTAVYRRKRRKAK